MDEVRDPIEDVTVLAWAGIVGEMVHRGALRLQVGYEEFAFARYAFAERLRPHYRRQRVAKPHGLLVMTADDTVQQALAPLAAMVRAEDRELLLHDGVLIEARSRTVTVVDREMPLIVQIWPLVAHIRHMCEWWVAQAAAGAGPLVASGVITATALDASLSRFRHELLVREAGESVGSGMSIGTDLVPRYHLATAAELALAPLTPSWQSLLPTWTETTPRAGGIAIFRHGTYAGNLPAAPAPDLTVEN